jgi:hypothetical protein
MAHFAEIGLNNVVLRVIVVANEELLDENGQESEAKGAEFCRNLLGGPWVQTSYNANFRKNFAGIGYTYDSDRNAFIPPKPYPSWVLNEDTCQWAAPVAHPNDGQPYYWDEASVSWVLVEQSAIEIAPSGSASPV